VNFLGMLEEAEKKKQRRTTPHNTRECVTRVVHAAPEKTRNACGAPTDKRGQKGKGAAEVFGLCAAWSYQFTYVSLHDPTTGEWHDLSVKDAPGWAKWEARKRKELYRGGNHKAYRLTSREMEEIWEAESESEPEGIVDDHPVEDEDELGTD
jgi:hypothetical protein